VFLPGSHHLPRPSFLPVTRRGRERKRMASPGKWRRAGLASWATRAFLNCIPACVATSRFTHVDTRVHTCACNSTRTCVHATDTEATKSDFRVGVHRARLLVNIPANISPLSSFALLFRALLASRSSPSVYHLILSFSRRHVRETAP